jgi:hypothetical protein
MVRAREGRPKEGGFLSKFRAKAQNLWLGDKGISTNLTERVPIVRILALGTPAASQANPQCSFFDKLSVELRLKIYAYVVNEYSDTIHILAGEENGRPSRTLFHSRCITPSHLEVPSWWIFDSSRWSSGPWGSYHFYCDLYSSKVSVFHDWVISFKHRAKALEESRTAYEVVSETAQKLQDRAPFLPLLLSCRRMLVFS